MPSIQGLARRFHTVLFKTNGQPFLGTIMPTDEGRFPSYEFTSARLLLRTSTPHAVSAGEVIFDEAETRFLVANHGGSGRGGYDTFRLLQINAEVVWSRQTRIVDDLTKVPRGAELVELGRLPVLMELTGREIPDRATNIGEETRRVLTGAELQLGDQIDDAVVQRLERVLGVTYAEIR